MCPRRESNPQPSDPKSGALSIELRGRKASLFRGRKITGGSQYSVVGAHCNMLLWKRQTLVACVWKSGARTHSPFMGNLIRENESAQPILRYS